MMQPISKNSINAASEVNAATSLRQPCEPKVHKRLRERREREEGAETHAARAARSTSESARFYSQGGSTKGRCSTEKSGLWEVRRLLPAADRIGLSQSGRRAASTTGALFHGKLTIRYRKVSTHVVFKMKLSGELRTTP